MVILRVTYDLHFQSDATKVNVTINETRKAALHASGRETRERRTVSEVSGEVVTRDSRAGRIIENRPHMPMSLPTVHCVPHSCTECDGQSVLKS